MASRTFEKIIGLMKLKGVSKEQFLNDLKIDEEKFKAWENGMPISDDELLEIAKYLGVTFDFFTFNAASDEKGKTKRKSESNIMDKVNDLYDEKYAESKESQSFSSKIFGNSDGLNNTQKTISKVITIITVLVFIGLFIYFCIQIMTTSGENSFINGFLIVFGILVLIIIITTLIRVFKKK